MLRRSIRFATAALVLGAAFTSRTASAQPAAQPAAPAAPAAATAPAPAAAVRADAGTTIPLPADQRRHLDFMDVASQGGIDLIFEGDSITDGWRGKGLKVWGETWGPLKAVDFGIGGERVEQTLWRAQSGELDGYKAKLIVLMIGTNNLARSSNRAIAEGIKVLCAEFQKRQPEAKILLLGIFPREIAATHPSRQRIKEINAEISKLDDGKKIFFMDIGEKFLTADGTLTKEIMPDALHPNAKGYQIWADATQAKVKELMGAK